MHWTVVSKKKEFIMVLKPSILAHRSALAREDI